MFHFVCVFCLICLIPGIISGGGLGKKLLQLFLLPFTGDYLTNKTAKKMWDLLWYLVLQYYCIVFNMKRLFLSTSPPQTFKAFQKEGKQPTNQAAWSTGCTVTEFFAPPLAAADILIFLFPLLPSHTISWHSWGHNAICETFKTREIYGGSQLNTK